MSIEKVREYFKSVGMDSRIKEFSESSATVELAAHALGCTPDRIAKTLSFKVKDDCILIVTAGDVKVDNSKYKAQFGVKAVMLKFDEVAELIGHTVGGVCPFADKEGVKVYLDESLKKYDIVYPAAGSDNSAVEITIPQLEQYSCFLEWVDVCKEMEAET